MSERGLFDQHATILTRRQRQVLRLQAYGLTHQEISEHLGLSIWTVKNHHKQAVKTLALSLRTIPRERVRTSLACYILGLLDGGWSPHQVALHLKDVSPPTHPVDMLADAQTLADAQVVADAQVLADAQTLADAQAPAGGDELEPAAT